MLTVADELKAANAGRISVLHAAVSIVVLNLVPGAWTAVYSHQNAWRGAQLSPVVVAATLTAILLVAWLITRIAGWLISHLLGRRVSIGEAGFTGCIVNTIVLAFLWWRGIDIGRLGMAVAYAAAVPVFISLLWCRVANKLRFASLLAIAGLLVAVNSPPMLDLLTRPRPEAPAQRRSVETSLYGLDLRIYNNQIEKPFSMGGAVAPLPDGHVLLVTGDGLFFLLREDPERLSLNVRQLALRAPINNGSFRAFAKGTAIFAPHFRVADLLVVFEGDTATIFVSHHYFYEAEACTTLRVSRITLSMLELLNPASSGDWTTQYETFPCLGMKHPNPFGGHQVGGRLALLNERTLLLSVGDEEFDRVNSDEDLPQDLTVNYGKILAVDLQARVAEILSAGHRNPQGLLVTRQGEIWETEHGPQGGDELNRIERGANYGWPIVTYGTNYGSRTWPLNRVQGRHDGFWEPKYAWVPSIGITDLVQLDHEAFRLWRDDLIIASMTAKRLFRIRLVEGRPVLVEPIAMPFGIRDIAETRSGKLVLWSKSGDSIGFMSVQPNDSSSGAQAFAACSGCHAIGTGADHGIGPDLHGVFGRRIGAAQGFGYSAALAQAGGTWTDEALDALLAAPSDFLPGTSMQFQGIADAGLRRLLIDHLKSH